ncbi:hypothetical protein TYRP_013918 [Tyrophagus putrescentiae]|nr:hypothetical protein TYRP_013918 [Tyrophagus putrescentiae]
MPQGRYGPNDVVGAVQLGATRGSEAEPNKQAPSGPHNAQLAKTKAISSSRGDRHRAPEA